VLQSWTIVFSGLAYVALLFVVATWGDRLAKTRVPGSPRPLIYSLSLAVYCTSWTYFGSVGVASKSGLDFLPIYIGPIIVFALGWKMLQSIAELAKRQNIASIAARYGKNQALGALVAIVAVIGIVPYISIQLKAVAFSLQTILTVPDQLVLAEAKAAGADVLALIVAAAMAAFAILFGTRHIDTTEHQDGMVLAISAESIVKLVAFLAVGIFVTFFMMGGIGALVTQASVRPDIVALFDRSFDGGRWLTMTLLAAIAIILLPRQFHMSFVENTNRGDIRRAAWLFPLYLIAINIFVVPVAIAGLLLLPAGTDGDSFVLALPLLAQDKTFTLIAFLGGLSAATAMVIVETIALSIMVCNNLVIPVLLRRGSDRAHIHQDMGRRLITIRRWAIVIILLLAYSYYLSIGTSAALAQIGLISFAAVAQFAPAFFGGLIWRRGTAAGAKAGIIAGFALWVYTLLLPSFADAGWIGRAFVEQGPFGLSFLKPRTLFNLEFETLTHGVLWSLAVNIAAYIAFSLLRQPTPIERLQASAFVAHDFPATAPSFRLWRTAVTIQDLQDTVSRYLGPGRTKQAFDAFIGQRGVNTNTSAEADVRTLRFSEHLLASAVGAASSRLVMALLLERHSKSPRSAISLLDDASAAIQHNRDLLQSAIDSVRQGIAVLDSDLNLICWNHQFQHLLDLPSDLMRIGAPLDNIVAAIADAGDEKSMIDRKRTIAIHHGVFIERMKRSGLVLEVRSNAMPGGGTVVTCTDITERVVAAEELQKINETLEQRVVKRTAELMKLNSELDKARAAAEDANLGKTRFIAAASHDILQPLNAARLFASSLVERHSRSKDTELVRNLDASLESVEDILSALLDISKLDAGGFKPEPTAFQIGEILQALSLEFAPLARKKGLKLTVMPCRLAVRTDRKSLRRILQNFLANAIKYTPSGRVLIGCSRAGKALRVEVHDTGPGIPAHQQKLVFREFERLHKESSETPGLGLGLSIVDRMAKILGHKLALKSKPGAGSMFSIELPIANAADVQKPVQRIRTPRRAPGSAFTVLVIDNEQAILDGMEALLLGWGCTVHKARDQAQAIQAFEKAGAVIDVILADYHLNRETGIDAVEAIRKRTKRFVPALLISADRTKQVQDLATAHDMHLLRKPVKPAALRAAMAHATAKAEAAE
jgi:Na+/proline symporter/signal transduction histidine kinase/CheY-like chemotaxis protein